MTIRLWSPTPLAKMCDRALRSTPLPLPIVARPKHGSNPTLSLSVPGRFPTLASLNNDGDDGDIRLKEQVREKGLELESEREGAVEIELSKKEGETERWRGRGRRGREMVRRSNVVAKQVIAVESALSLGFVSQLWVDPSSWSVMVVEVRPSLLAGDSERFLLADVCKVGDVLLVENERVLDSELKMAGLETLVGYEVVTSGRRSIGKVRGYSFNVNSGVIELLEIDSFGISIVPSSLVSTYALYAEDVMEVASDTVFVQEAAAGRLQRLTKGWWDSQNLAAVGGKYDEDVEKPFRSSRSRSGRRGSRRKKYPGKASETDDDWDLPMDFS